MSVDRTYIAIDLKSFYASVECRERGLDPMTTNLVVADASRTAKTICLAVSPSLKSYGIPGRPRLFQVIQKVKEANNERLSKAPGRTFAGTSADYEELIRNPSLGIDYLVAPPRMAFYMKYSTDIYQVYLKYIAPEDIHVYSIDEVFIDATAYLNTYGMTARELARTMIGDVLKTTGITATAGIAPNLFLCKAAMDIVAKHIPADQEGVRIAELDEKSYRRQLWSHTPITDFWRVGRGYAKKLENVGIHTMGDVARCSLGGPNEYYNEDLLFQLFGVNAELLIDHAWGYEPCTIKEIKAYKPEDHSIGSGQVLSCPYTWEKTRLVVWEMADALSLSLAEKQLVTDQIVLTVGYDIENLTDKDNSGMPKESGRSGSYQGEITIDRYGRRIPKHGHGTENLDAPTASTQKIIDATLRLYDRISNPTLLVRRLSIYATHIIPEQEVKASAVTYEQLDLFTDYAALEKKRAAEQEKMAKEKNLQQAMLKVRNRYGKDAILRGNNLVDGATAKDRNHRIGGHHE